MRKQIGWRPFWLAALMSAAFVLWTTSPRWLAREAPVLPPADPFWTEAQSSGLTDEELADIDIYNRASSATVNVTSRGCGGTGSSRCIRRVSRVRDS